MPGLRLPEPRLLPAQAGVPGLVRAARPQQRGHDHL